MKRKFRLLKHAQHITNQVIVNSDPIAIFKVVDERGEIVAFITNTAAAGRTPRWRIENAGTIGNSGPFSTPEDALSALERQL